MEHADSTVLVTLARREARRAQSDGTDPILRLLAETQGIVVVPDRALRAVLDARDGLAALLPRAGDFEIAAAIALAARSSSPGQRALRDLPAVLAYEPSLHLTELLRLDIVAACPESAESDRASAASAGLALLTPASPGPVQERVTTALAALARASAAATARIFNEAVARALTGNEAAARIAESEAPIDELIEGILEGATGETVQKERAAPMRATSLRQAWLAGACVARNPDWWPELWAEIERRGGFDWDALPALLGGVVESGVAPSGPIAATLSDGLRAIRPTIRQCALTALSKQHAPDDTTLESLAALVRDPVEPVRVELAQALLGAGPWGAPLVARLGDDPSPAVRGAAAFTALGRGEADETLHRRVRGDFDQGSPALRFGAAMAAACLGYTDPAIGELLVDAAADLEPESGSEWAGLERWASPIWPLWAWASSAEAREHLYQRAAEDDRWLLAFGELLALGNVAPAKEPLAARIRDRALTLLGEHGPQAARILAHHAVGDVRVLDLFDDESIPLEDRLPLLAASARILGLARPSATESLLAALEDDTLAPLAATCLGELARPDDQRVASALERGFAGPSRDVFYNALARLVARRVKDATR